MYMYIVAYLGPCFFKILVNELDEIAKLQAYAREREVNTNKILTIDRYVWRAVAFQPDNMANALYIWTGERIVMRGEYSRILTTSMTESVLANFWIVWWQHARCTLSEYWKWWRRCSFGKWSNEIPIWHGVHVKTWNLKFIPSPVQFSNVIRNAK